MIVSNNVKLFQTASNHIKPFKPHQTFQTISNQFKQLQTMSNYNFKFFLNFLSVSALRPDLSGNLFYKKAMGNVLGFIKKLGAEGGNWRPNNITN